MSSVLFLLQGIVGVDLTGKTLQELIALRQEVDAEIGRRTQGPAVAEGAILRLAKEYDIDLESLAKKPVRYYNPDDPFQFWEGRGRPPKWLNKVKKGEGENG